MRSPASVASGLARCRMARAGWVGGKSARLCKGMLFYSRLFTLGGVTVGCKCAHFWLIQPKTGCNALRCTILRGGTMVCIYPCYYTGKICAYIFTDHEKTAILPDGGF